MASRLCRETQTSLCIKNPANITAIRKQQQQYQYIPGSSLYERDFFIFSCYNTRYLGDQSKESEGIWGQLIFRKMYDFYSLYGFCLLLYTYYQDMYLVQSIYAIDSSRTFRIFFFFPLRELQKRIQGEHVLHSSGLLQEKTPQKYSKYQKFCFTIKFDILVI